ncbi:sugar ABC transporter ATP-binding protein [Brachyspira alvinipulli]|uniref:sugar ABC transporter ATP-binding protein n=1 Tax=Brachyspira alvinipulli TaxID=84379 RepID=UPI000485F6E2|nr:sugar ABC transporter ATP-binding protein [Brachyspira alvinipulli]
MSNKDAIINLKNIGKSFGSTRALESISFDFKRGDITAIVGANGAGKSTLIKIICGYHTKYDGEIFVEGNLVKFTSPLDAYSKGIQTVHQIINQGVVQSMTVAENLVLKDILTNKKNFFIKKKDYMEHAERVADLMGIDHSILNKEVFWTSQSERQLIIIARALESNPKLLILDEPTAAISEKETEILFDKLNGLREKNVTILYVSHRLHEIERIADNVVVIRDGKVSDIMEKPIKVNKIVTAMIGSVPKTVKAVAKEERKMEPLLETKDLVFMKNGSPINLTLYKGEITAIVGLIGAGKSEFGETLFSIKKPISGEIFMNGQKIEHKNIGKAIKNGIHLVPEDRSNNAIFPNFSITENITIPFLNKFSPKLIMEKKLEKKSSLDIVEKLSLKYGSIEDMMDSLSGGNQQKVIVARWIFQNYNLIILDEPFQGVDIASRFDMGEYLRKNIKDSAALILVADLDEAIEVADRIIVFNSGKMVFEQYGNEIDRDKLLHYISCNIDELNNTEEQK